MKEPAKESASQVFQSLKWCEDDDDDDDDIDTPLRHSTPNKKKESSSWLSFCRSNKLDQQFQTELAQRDEGLVGAWKQENECDKILESDAIPRRLNCEQESRLSALSSQSTQLSEGCLENCELPEPVLDLIKELAKQLLCCQKNIAYLKEENKKLLRQEKENGVNEMVKKRETELVSEIEAWKESSNESRKEIESLKNTLRSYEEQIEKLKSEKKQMTHKLSRLKINHGNLEKDEPLLAARLAQQTHFSQNLNTLKMLNDKQHEVIGNLQNSVSVEKSRKSLPIKNKMNLSSSSGRSTLRSSLNVSRTSNNSLAKTPSTQKTKNSLQPSVQYDESIIKLSQLLIKSNEMLREVENSKDKNLS